MPEDRGRMVTAFLVASSSATSSTTSPPRWRRSSTTSPAGASTGSAVLRDFWQRLLDGGRGAPRTCTIRDVIDALDEELGPHFFPAPRRRQATRALCPTCGNGRLGLRLGSTGAFIGCSNYPECRYTRPLALPGEADGEGAARGRRQGARQGPRDRPAGHAAQGPYGFYVQLGEGSRRRAPKPKRVLAAAAASTPAAVTLDRALGLLSLPREVGRDPETGETITAGIGRFGPYLARRHRVQPTEGRRRADRRPEPRRRRCSPMRAEARARASSARIRRTGSRCWRARAASAPMRSTARSWRTCRAAPSGGRHAGAGGAAAGRASEAAARARRRPRRRPPRRTARPRPRPRRQRRRSRQAPKKTAAKKAPRQAARRRSRPQRRGGRPKTS